MENIIIGIDIGGTTAKIGLLKATGDILEKWEIPTVTENKGKLIINHVCQSIERKLREFNYKKDNVLGIGIGVPGFIDAENGFVYEAVNIGWENINITKKVEEKLKLPTFLENDANVAVLGENWLGAGNQDKDILAVTLGTGVGGGIIASGKVLNGSNGTAGEIGHMTVDIDGPLCNCGRKGCLETYVSATGMVRQAMEMISKHPTSNLAKRYKANECITTQDIFELLEENDPISQQIINFTTDVLGKELANVATILNPSKILIGGGVSKAGDQLMIPLKTAFKKYSLPRIHESCEFKVAQLGNDAGIIGASYLVKQNIQRLTF